MKIEQIIAIIVRVPSVFKLMELDQDLKGLTPEEAEKTIMDALNEKRVSEPANAAEVIAAIEDVVAALRAAP